MPRKRKRLGLMVFFLLLSSLLSACQNGPTEQARACHQQAFPVGKTREPIQVSSQMVYASNGYELYAFNAGNGAQRWCSAISVGNGRDLFASLTYSRGSVYAYTEAGDLTSFHAASGALVWSNYIENLSLDNFTSPSILNTTVYGGTKSIYALNTQDGSVRWHFALPDQAYANYIPVANNGAAYFSINQGGVPQHVYALDATTGNTRWMFSFPEGEDIRGQLAVGEGVVVFPYQKESPDGVIHFGLDVLNAQNGRLLWQKAIGDAMASVGASQDWAIANDLLYVVGAVPDNGMNAITSLYAFDLLTGSMRWSVPTTDRAIDGSLLVVNTVLYSVYQSGSMNLLNALNAQTGQALWHTSFPLGFLSRLTILNDHLFVGTKSADQAPVYLLHAFNINTHQEDWFVNITGDADASDYSLGVSLGG